MTHITFSQQTTRTHSTADGGCLSAPAVGLPEAHREHNLALYNHACSYGGQLSNACSQCLPAEPWPSTAPSAQSDQTGAAQEQQLHSSHPDCAHTEPRSPALQAVYQPTSAAPRRVSASPHCATRFSAGRQTAQLLQSPGRCRTCEHNILQSHEQQCDSCQGEPRLHFPFHMSVPPSSSSPRSVPPVVLIGVRWSIAQPRQGRTRAEGFLVPI